MCGRNARWENLAMDNERPAEHEGIVTKKPARIVELEREMDERDETIRMLNEALSHALDELAAMPEAA
jgi:hypothetical protein